MYSPRNLLRVPAASGYPSGGIDVHGLKCPICFDAISQRNAFVLSCGHVYCAGCIKAWLENRVRDREVDFKCFSDQKNVSTRAAPTGSPLAGLLVCQRPISDADIELALGPGPSLQRYVRFKRMRTEPLLRECPYCSEAQTGSPATPDMTCGACGKEYCFTHSNAHAGKTCAQYISDHGSQDAADEAAIMQDCKRCPRCNAATQKRDGCNQVSCAICKAHWCWLCGKEVDKSELPTHFQWWNINGCANRQFSEGAVTPMGKLGTYLYFIVLGVPSFIITAVAYAACFCVCIPASIFYEQGPAAFFMTMTSMVSIILAVIVLTALGAPLILPFALLYGALVLVCLPCYIAGRRRQAAAAMTAGNGPASPGGSRTAGASATAVAAGSGSGGSASSATPLRRTGTWPGQMNSPEGQAQAQSTAERQQDDNGAGTPITPRRHAGTPRGRSSHNLTVRSPGAISIAVREDGGSGGDGLPSHVSPGRGSRTRGSTGQDSPYGPSTPTVPFNPVIHPTASDDEHERPDRGTPRHTGSGAARAALGVDDDDVEVMAVTRNRLANTGVPKRDSFADAIAGAAWVAARDAAFARDADTSRDRGDHAASGTGKGTDDSLQDLGLAYTAIDMGSSGRGTADAVASVHASRPSVHLTSVAPPPLPTGAAKDGSSVSNIGSRRHSMSPGDTPSASSITVPDAGPSLSSVLSEGAQALSEAALAGGAGGFAVPAIVRQASGAALRTATAAMSALASGGAGPDTASDTTTAAGPRSRHGSTSSAGHGGAAGFVADNAGVGTSAAGDMTHSRRHSKESVSRTAADISGLVSTSTVGPAASEPSAVHAQHQAAAADQPVGHEPEVVAVDTSQPRADQSDLQVEDVVINLG